MNNGLLNLKYGGINLYHEMDNSVYNSMETLIDNIIFKSKDFCTGAQLQELNDVLTRVLMKYELINVKTEDEVLNYKENNLELINKFSQVKSLEGCSAGTINAYTTIVDKFIEWVDKDLNEVSTEDIRAYLKYKMTVDGVSNGYADTILRYLRTTFKWLSDEGYIFQNPTTPIPKIKSKKQLKEPFSHMDIEKLREAFHNIHNEKRKLRDIAIFELLLSSGIRIGELVQLDKIDIDWKERSFIVFGKGQKERKAYFNVKTKKALREYLNYRGNDDYAPLFISLRHTADPRLKVNVIERVIREIGLSVGVKAHPHKFRRTFATNMLKKGTPLEQVQQLLGHNNMETTTLYAIVDDEQVQFNHRRLMD